MIFRRGNDEKVSARDRRVPSCALIPRAQHAGADRQVALRFAGPNFAKRDKDEVALVGNRGRF